MDFTTIKISSTTNLVLEDNTNYLLVLDDTNQTFNVNVDQQPGFNNVIMVVDLSSDSTLSLFHNVLQDSYCRYQFVNLSTGKNTYNLEVSLTQEGSNCDLNLIACSVNSSLEVNATLDNLVSHTTANMWMRGVSLNSSISFKPTGSIKTNTTGCKNFQTSRILLLDDNQHAQVDPLLLIDHFDVEAGHGASISRVNEQELYYLQSRGISKAVAQQLLTIGFIKPGLDVLDDIIKDPLLDIIAQRFNLS